jgi:hypothetical protein
MRMVMRSLSGLGRPAWATSPESSAAQAGRLSPFGHPLMMFPAILRQK